MSQNSVQQLVLNNLAYYEQKYIRRCEQLDICAKKNTLSVEATQDIKAKCLLTLHNACFEILMSTIPQNSKDTLKQTAADDDDAAFELVRTLEQEHKLR